MNNITYTDLEHVHVGFLLLTPFPLSFINKNNSVEMIMNRIFTESEESLSNIDDFQRERSQLIEPSVLFRLG